MLCRIYNLSFDQIEYQINDRLSFMWFLGLGLNDKVLDSRTIWDFENTLAQKDTDARWAKKNNETHFSYKDHVKCDADSKLIINYAVTDAALHDSNRLQKNRKKTTDRNQRNAVA